LRIVQLSLPALRERGDDILLLARNFLAYQSKRYHKGPLRFSAESEKAMLDYPWPGNVRELRNIIEQTVLMATSPVIEPAHLPFCAVLGIGTPSVTPVQETRSLDEGVTLERAEREMLSQAMNKTAWNVTQAARLLGVSRDTLRYRLDKHGLTRKN